jgi:hypothetical protein
MDAFHNRETEVDYSNRLQPRSRDPNPIPIGHTLRASPNRDNDSNTTNEDLRSQDLSGLKPMSPEQFMRRFTALQLGEGSGAAPSRNGDDRFSMIKSSLQELRRGLNEVSMHYMEIYHHQPINVPTAWAQAFLMDYPQGERAIIHHAGPVRVGGC